MKKLIMTIFTVCMLFSTAYAADMIECTLNAKTNEVSINADFTAANAGESCNILVLNPGFELSDLPDPEYKAIQKQAEAYLDESGRLKVAFMLNTANISASGDCKVYARLQNDSELGQSVHESSFYYATESEKLAAVRDLNSCRNLSDSEVMKKLEDYKNVLSYSFSAYEKIDKSALAAALKRSTTPQFSESDFSEAQEWIMTQSVVEAYNQGLDEILYSGNEILYDEYIKFSEIDAQNNTTVFSLYTDKLNTDGTKGVQTALLGNGCRDAAELRKAFGEAVVVEAVRNYNESGYGHIGNVLSANNASYVGLDISKYSKTASANQYILAADASTVNELQTAVNNSGKVSDDTGSSGGGLLSGGGSPSGGIGNSGSGVVSVSPSENTNEGGAVSDLDIDLKASVIDMDNTEWAIEAVMALIEKGVISRPDDGKFRPDDYITREEFVKMAVLAFGIPMDTDGIETGGFSDVSDSDWSAQFIYAAKANGIINGIGDGLFGKKDYLSRQDMAVILKRCCDYLEMSLNQTVEDISFEDSENISEYAAEAVDVLAGCGVINGMGDGTFKPFENCTRAQCAKVIYLLIKE